MSKLAKGKTRIIKINKDAVFEFVYEKFIDDFKEYFNLSNTDGIFQTFMQDDETGDFLMLIRNDSDYDNDEIRANLGQIIKKIDITTDSMYSSKNRYIELPIKDVLALIDKD